MKRHLILIFAKETFTQRHQLINKNNNNNLFILFSLWVSTYTHTGENQQQKSQMFWQHLGTIVKGN